MSRVKWVFVSLLVSFIIFSCARETDPTEDFMEESFLAWIAKNAPNADSLPGNVYIEYKERADNYEDLPTAILDTSWLRVNYTGYTLAGDIFETRDSALAIQMGTWAYNTHFKDDYLLYSLYNTKLCYGLMIAFDTMRAGDSARVYIPAEFGYSSSMSTNAGYTGLSSSYTGYPIMFDIRLAAIENDPDTVELELLNRWVAKNWGLTEDDTIKTGLYYRITSPYAAGDTITSDSSITYDVSSYFLDFHPNRTTLEDVALDWGYYSSDSTYSSVNISSSTFEDTTGTYSAYSQVILQMRKGEVAEGASISSYLTGIYGWETALPQVLPYEPQWFVIEVDADEDDPDDDDDEDEEED